MTNRDYVCRLIVWSAAAAGLLSAQSISVDKSSISFSTLTGAQPVAQSLNVTSPGVSISFTVQTPAGSFVQVAPLSGITPSALTVTASPVNLLPGVYNSKFTISGGAAPLDVPVTLTVSSLAASPASLSFAYQINGNLPPASTVNLTGQTQAFTAAAASSTASNWLQVSPLSGVSPGTLSVSLNAVAAAGLGPGAYSGAVTVTPSASGAAAVTIPVSLTVTPAPPVTIAPASVNLDYQLGGVNNQPQQPVTLSTTSAQALSFSATGVSNPNPAGKNWILANPSSGSIPANGSSQVSVGFDATVNLPAGTYLGNVALNTPGAAMQQQTIPVSLAVSNSPFLMVPGTPVNFTYEIGGNIPNSRNVVASSTAVAAGAATGQMALTVSASTSSGGPWLLVNPQGAALSTGSATPIPISVNPVGLAVGSYSGTVTVSGTNAANGPQMIPVVLTVADDPMVVTSTGALQFPYQIGQSAPAGQAVGVTSSTATILNYTATAAASTCGNSWLGLSGATSSTTNNSFTVSVNTAGLAAGTCTGTVTIAATDTSTGNPVLNSGVKIPVTLVISANPLLTVYLAGNPPSPPVFTALLGGNSSDSQTITLGSTNSKAPLHYSLLANTPNNGNWLLVSPSSGTTDASPALTVSANSVLLSPGTYNGDIEITATNPNGAAVANSPMTIPVTLHVTSGTMSVTGSTLKANTLTFTQAAGGGPPAPQTLQVTSSGSPLQFGVTATDNGWLAASATGSATPGTVTVAVDGADQSPGTYIGVVSIAGVNAGNSPANILVVSTVTQGTISAPTATMNFTQAVGAAAPPAQTVAVSGTPTSLAFTLTTTTQNNGSWLTAAAGTPQASNGATPATISVAVDGSGLAPGIYKGSVTISASGAAGSPISIPVVLMVLSAQTLAVSPGTLNFTYALGGAAPAGSSAQVTASGSGAQISVSTTDNWLSITPANGPAPLALTVKINPTGLSPGSYTSVATIGSLSAAAPVTLTVKLTVTALPAPVIQAITNAASYSTGALAPGENVVLFGAGLGPSSLAKGTWPAAGPMPTTVGNTQVLFDGVAAPILYASDAQTSVIVPFGISGRAMTQVQVVYQNVPSAPATYNVVAAAPGIYAQNQQGSGPGDILNQNNSINGPTNGAFKGSYVQIYLTGAGVTSPAAVTGGVAPLNSVKNVILPMTATVGGVPVPAIPGTYYAGSAPGLIEGVYQVNIKIPESAPSGVQPLVLTFGSGASTYSTQANLTVQIRRDD